MRQQAQLALARLLGFSLSEALPSSLSVCLWPQRTAYMKLLPQHLLVQLSGPV